MSDISYKSKREDSGTSPLFLYLFLGILAASIITLLVYVIIY